MTYPSPIHLGAFAPAVAGSVVDEYIDITADLATGEAISTVTFTVTDAAGAVVAGAVSAHSETATRTDFRYSIAAAGAYLLAAVFLIDDGQKFTRTASLWIV